MVEKFEQTKDYDHAYRTPNPFARLGSRDAIAEKRALREQFIVNCHKEEIIMNRRRIYLAVITLVAAVAYVGAGHTAGQEFTEASLKGVYGFSGSGTLGGQPAAVAGLTTFDGGGGCDIKAQLNLAGNVIPLSTLVCSYTVDPDGTGSLNVALASPFASPFGAFTSNFVIVDGGNELHAVLSDLTGNTVGATVTKRQAKKDD